MHALVRFLCCVATTLGASVLAVGLSMAGWVGYLVITGNIHTVVPGVLYRSAASRAGFQRTIMRFHIHTVINLRGVDLRQPWYEDELAAARVSGAQHIDLRMSATHMPSPATLDELRTILNHATLPILIHCQSGADRSGLVAALYELWVVHRSPAEASLQLSFRYGHFPWLGSRTSAMDEAWRQLSRHDP